MALREDQADGKPYQYWLSHGSQLLRCAPHHVRPDFRQAADTLVGDIAEARKSVLDYVHRFRPDPIKQLNIFSSKNVKKCKPKKQPEKKKTNQKAKKMQKKSKKNTKKTKKTKKKQKMHKKTKKKQKKYKSKGKRNI
jgi:hypothetical protein